MKKEKFIKDAIESFGGMDKFFGVFSTACYQQAVKREFGIMPTGRTVKKHLKDHPRVLELSGGCHWKYS